jgi:hypothetical protein
MAGSVYTFALLAAAAVLAATAARAWPADD